MIPVSSPHRVDVPPEHDGWRLDKALPAALREFSRTRLQALIAGGQVSCNGHPLLDAAGKVRAGEKIDILIPAAEDATPAPQALPLTIVYEDDDLLVIDKQAGMTVHPAPGSPDKTLVNALLAYCGETLSGIGGVRRPGIVHRLDKETSGLMVVAKNDFTHVRLSRQLADRSLSRRYLAVVWGRPNPPSGRVDQPIGRSPADRKKMAIVGNGRAAITDYALLKPVGGGASLIECRLQTGRTHQIRVHMAALGHPLVGDPTYGRRLTKALRGTYPALAAFTRQALHAAEISFIHPQLNNKLTFQSELPPDLLELIASATIVPDLHRS
jgi:23S rRNA pseudouridine1911/1915/1917 synthase